MKYITPAGSYPAMCADLLGLPHLLIAGSTGSGKSTLINSIIGTAMYRDPGAAGLILIDPKRVELARYGALPHCLSYSQTSGEAAEALASAVSLMMRRYDRMSREGLRKTAEGDIYVIIDEYADLIIEDKRRVLPLVLRLAQLGRAAGVHLIIATQRPTADIVNGAIKCNMDYRIALHCPTPQDSRNIISRSDAAGLPLYGFGYLFGPAGVELVKIPETPEPELNRLVAWWTDQSRHRLRLFSR